MFNCQQISAYVRIGPRGSTCIRDGPAVDPAAQLALLLLGYYVACISVPVLGMFRANYINLKRRAAHEKPVVFYSILVGALGMFSYAPC